MAGIEASMITSLGTCRPVIPLLESTMASARAVGQTLANGRFDPRALVRGELLRRLENGAQALVRIAADRGQRLAVLREEPGEEGLHRVAEDDRVGDPHHRGLDLQREEHALGLGARDLLGEELAQRGSAHHAGVHDLARP